MAIVLNDQHLRNLGLRMIDLQELSEEDQAKAIKKAWRKMVLATHPDKGGEPEQFRIVNNAYTALMTGQVSGVQFEYEINNYFTKQPINIPDTTFDIPMQEGIFEIFEELRKQFSALPNEGAKQRFATHYASFLTLAQSLEERREEFTSVRATALVHQEIEAGMFEVLGREWKMLIIRLFAEEYLDDFQYRNALAFGDLLPILATSKLISPVKWLAAIVGGLDLLFRGSAEYYIKKGSGNTAYLLLLIGSPVSLVNFFVDLIASPINNLVRPSAAYTGLPPAAFTLLYAGIGAALLYELINSAVVFSFAGAMVLLPYINLAINLYSIFVTVQLIRNLHENGFKGDAFEIGLSFGIMILINLIPSSEPIMDMMWTVSGFCLIDSTKKILEERPIEFLPLPEKPVPENVIDATLLGYKKANQSHRFFGTPKDADFQNDRTIWQKTAGFFGVDLISSKAATPDFKEHLRLEMIATTV